MFAFSDGYMQLISEGYTGGERALLISPKYTSTTTSCLSFYLIAIKDDSEETDLDNVIRVYVNDLTYPIAGRQVWQTGMKGNTFDGQTLGKV